MTTFAKTVSIIMPVRNEADYIALSLGSIAKQSYPMEMIEVLIADGMTVITQQSCNPNLPNCKPKVLGMGDDFSNNISTLN